MVPLATRRKHFHRVAPSIKDDFESVARMKSCHHFVHIVIVLVLRHRRSFDVEELKGVVRFVESRGVTIGENESSSLSASRLCWFVISRDRFVLSSRFRFDFVLTCDTCAGARTKWGFHNFFRFVNVVSPNFSRF